MTYSCRMWNTNMVSKRFFIGSLQFYSEKYETIAARQVEYVIEIDYILVFTWKELFSY
jgi:hypothetical protein